MPDYHHLVFALLESDPSTNARILRATLEPQDERRAYWSQRDRVGAWSGDAAWMQLNAYLMSIEYKIQSVVQQHSHFFWLHLYRRIGVMLHRALNNSQDSTTVSLVRSVVEAAFVRYGKLDESSRDMAISTDIELGEIAGGLYLTALSKIAEEKEYGKDEFIGFFAKYFKLERTWILKEFRAEDYINIYGLEALCHEYWFVNALMRRIGKGAKLVVDDDGAIQGESSDEVESLVRNYDERIKGNEFNATGTGVAFYGDLARRDLMGLVASYNIERSKWAEIAVTEVVAEMADLVTNFQFAPFSFSSYANAHLFAAEPFKSKRGFSLVGFCGYLAAASFCELIYINRREGTERMVAWKELYQRAYAMHTNTGYRDRLVEVAVDLMDRWLGRGNHEMRKEAPLVHEFLTLVGEKQTGTGLWSMGPRYLFVQHGVSTMVDHQASLVILRNAFMGVRYSQSDKGPVFEHEFRRYVVQSQLDLLPERMLKIDRSVRECDALVRCGDNLFVCECRAMERPLDFEIGRLRTIAARTADLQRKLEQARSLADALERNPRGTNYDFSWARNIVPIVVSPFVEWIWSRSRELWLSAEVPAILSAAEAVTFMKEKAREAQ